MTKKPLGVVEILPSVVLELLLQRARHYRDSLRVVDIGSLS